MKFLLIIGSIFNFMLLFSQSDSMHKTRAFKIYSASLNLGPQLNLNPMSFYEFVNSGVNHDFLKLDYAGFQEIKPITEDSNRGAHFTANANIIFYNKKQQRYNSRNEVNVRVTLLSMPEQSYNFQKTNIVAFDTLYSFNHAQQYFVTRQTQEDYGFTYISSAALFELGFKHYVRDQIKTWNAFAGFGLGFGRTFRNNLMTRHAYYETYTNQFGKNYYSEYDTQKISMPEDAYDIRLNSTNIQKISVSAGVQHRLYLKKSNRSDIMCIGMEALGGVLNVQNNNSQFHQVYFWAGNRNRQILLSERSLPIKVYITKTAIIFMIAA